MNRTTEEMCAVIDRASARIRLANLLASTLRTVLYQPKETGYSPNIPDYDHAVEILARWDAAP